jgi:hypothetical protein
LGKALIVQGLNNESRCHLQLNRGVVRRLSPRAPELNAKSFCNEIAELAFKSRSKWGRGWFTI